MNVSDEFFGKGEKGGVKSKTSVKGLSFNQVVMLLSLLTIAMYQVFKWDYVETRGDGDGVVRIYTVNRIAGTVCETAFFPKWREGEKIQPKAVCR